MGRPIGAALFYSYPLPLLHRMEIGQGGMETWQTGKNELQEYLALACGQW